MRAIRFKFWNPKDKKMTRSSFTLYEISMMLSLEHYSVPLQFTGLHDKNGKEVYEGDILSDGSDDPMLLPVIYDEEYTMFCVDISLKRDESSIDEIQTAYGRNFTVVGNIYENPELLND